MDYRPLVNARVDQFGRNREILNDRFLAQYQKLMKILSYRRQLDDTDLMTVVYYLLLQDRVEDGLTFFGRVNPERLATRLQYDYFSAFLDFSKSQPKLARQIAAKYADYPVDRWRNAFVNIVNQADEIDQVDVKVADNLDRTQVQTSEAAATPALDFTIEGKRIRLDYQRLDTVQVNYYLMDIELLFSRNPFVQGEARQFSLIVPNATQTLELPEKNGQFEFDLPEQLASTNVLVEIVGAGVYKDGYTDLRGRFDYTSLSTNELDVVEQFSLLILSDERGAIIREAKPPKR
jgi:hypothetical protein